MKLEVKEIKPRSQMVLAMIQRKAGAHGKSKKAERRREKMALQKENFGSLFLCLLKIYF